MKRDWDWRQAINEGALARIQTSQARSAIPFLIPGRSLSGANVSCGRQEAGIMGLLRPQFHIRLDPPKIPRGGPVGGILCSPRVSKL
jgi:hypothetical protein